VVERRSGRDHVSLLPLAHHWLRKASLLSTTNVLTRFSLAQGRCLKGVASCLRYLMESTTLSVNPASAPTAHFDPRTFVAGKRHGMFLTTLKKVSLGQMSTLSLRGLIFQLSRTDRILWLLIDAGNHDPRSLCTHPHFRNMQSREIHAEQNLW